MLFSFLMITYNQERYVRQALESALAQDIQELEIVICDDCSSDRTFEIATDIANRYTGPYKIILHRNESNVGISANFQKAYELSTGEWLFMAAGDDLSLPNRCKDVEKRLPLFPRALAFACNYSLIDENDKDYGILHSNKLLAFVAAICWNRRIFSSFPPMNTRIGVEDYPLFTRIFFLNGTYVKLPEVGVKYRVDGHSYTNEKRATALSVRKYHLKNNLTVLNSVENRLEALEYLSSSGHTVPEYERHLERQKRIKQHTKQEVDRLNEEIDVLTSSIFRKIWYCIKGGSHDNGLKARIRLASSGVGLLIALKRMFVPATTVLAEYAKETVSSLPDDLRPIEADSLYYLNHNDFDYTQL